MEVFIKSERFLLKEALSLTACHGMNCWTEWWPIEVASKHLNSKWIQGKKSPKKIHPSFFFSPNRQVVGNVNLWKETHFKRDREEKREIFSTCTFLFQFSKRSDRLTQALKQTPLLYGYMEPLTLWTVHMQTIYPIIPFQFVYPPRGEGWRKARRGSGKKDWGEKENKSVIKNAGVTGGG